MTDQSNFESASESIRGVNAFGGSAHFPSERSHPFHIVDVPASAAPPSDGSNSITDLYWRAIVACAVNAHKELIKAADRGSVSVTVQVGSPDQTVVQRVIAHFRTLAGDGKCVYSTRAQESYTTLVIEMSA